MGISDLNSASVQVKAMLIIAALARVYVIALLGLL